MAAKKIRLSVDTVEAIVQEFRESATKYGHAKKLGNVVGAALLMFLESSTAQQSEYVKKISVAEIDNAPRSLIEDIRRQHAEANERELMGDGGDTPEQSATVIRPTVRGGGKLEDQKGKGAG